MDCISTTISYEQTGYFSKIITDYLVQSPWLQLFHTHPVSLKGIQESMAARQSSPVNRALLKEELEKQYSHIQTINIVKNNINLLSQDGTFTITTAHQPNIFTGYLYFIYKIIHTIKLAQTLKENFPGNNFVPVFYMGSEDADLEELSKIYLNGEKITWDTKQKGAVGRMNTKGLEKIITRIEGEIKVQPHGDELIALLKECYTNNTDIQTATFKLVNSLFAEYGLVVLIADNANLKREMIDVFKDDLLHQTPSAIVEKTISKLSEHYKVQANPREVNLFYLKDDIRERIVKANNEWRVTGTDIRFSEKELLRELEQHPERFSPNVILRGLYQETILPNIAFIGGGGEIAYWLELKELFMHYNISFPVLILRNSFLLVEKKWQEKIKKLGFEGKDFFKEENLLMAELVKRDSKTQLSLAKEISDLQALYQHIKNTVSKIDSSLIQHTENLQTKAIQKLQRLEKKMLKAEKKKFDSAQHQLHAIKEGLFPKGNLQERTDNFIPYYAKYGKGFIQAIFDCSPTLEQKFVIVSYEYKKSLTTDHSLLTSSAPSPDIHTD